jgi:hypothetical protein
LGRSKLLRRLKKSDESSMSERVRDLNAVVHQTGKAKAGKGKEREGSCLQM